jgi:hypothetical protein
MSTKKKPVKKTASKAKKPATKVASKKAKAKKPATKVAAPKKATAKKTTAKKAKPATRRPDPNQPPSVDLIDAITDEILSLMSTLDHYAANLRALDRQRHNGVGLKRLGFIEAAFRISSKFPQYFPHWLNTAKFQDDLDLFNSIRSLVEVCRSLEEKAWNINVESSDMIYTNALEYYSQVQDAAKRRIDSAESLYSELHGFFRHSTTENGFGERAAPAQKKTKRDINALMKGKKDGEVIIRNINPKFIAGKREVIDETYKSSAKYKETGEGEIEE